MPELETLPQGERVMFVLMQALDALRDGLRPFVVTVLEQKEGPRWFEHPRVQRMVSVPASLQGEAPWGAEGPAFDLALLLKLIGSDCYWYRSFRPRLPGISRWQIDSLRELRNRVAHNDGSDPLLTSAVLALPYLETMERLLQVVGSDRVRLINGLRGQLRRSRRQLLQHLILGRSRWSLLFWLGLISTLTAAAWWFDYCQSPRLARDFLIIGTPDRRLERYRPLERDLETRLRPAQLWRALRGERIDVRIEGARSYPEAVAQLRAHRWDVLLGFSPVVSLEAVRAGYKPIGRMFPKEAEYRSILFTRAGSTLRHLDQIRPKTRIALGDFFSATKYYIPMSMLRGRSARLTLNLSTAEIAEQVRSGKAELGAMAGNPLLFEQLNPALRIVTTSAPLPASILALSPELADLDRNQLQQALLSAPASARGETAANYGPGTSPDYRRFARQIAEGKAFSACLNKGEGTMTLRCSSSDPIDLVQGWIEEARPEAERIRIDLVTADQRHLTLLLERSLLEQSAIFQVLSNLHGREIRVIALRKELMAPHLVIETPHQIEIGV